MTRFYSKELGTVNTKNTPSSVLSILGKRGADARKRNMEIRELEEKRKQELAEVEHVKRHYLPASPYCEGNLNLVKDEHGNEWVVCDLCGEQTEP